MSQEAAGRSESPPPEPPLEVEVKFLVDDLASFRERLIRGGAEQERLRVYERNFRFDTAGNDLLKKSQLLRLRDDGRVTLTFKSPPPAKYRSAEAKVYEELEVEVSDYAAMAAILERLGYGAIQVYEKYRETFSWNDVEIVLDEMPYGDFVELEGPEIEIKRAAHHLGLDWAQRIVTNYLALMAMLKETFQLPFDDVTFENFAGVDVSAADVLADIPR